MPVPVDLSKLIDVKKYYIKKSVYDKLDEKVNNINTSAFALKAKYETDKIELENKILELENKILILVDFFKNPTIMITLLKIKFQVLVVSL